MCSSDRQGLEVLENKLSRSGIPSEIRGNPLTAVLGIPRYELFVHEGDVPVASRLCQGETAVEVEIGSPAEFRNARRVNSFEQTPQSELLIEAKVIPACNSEPSREAPFKRAPEAATAVADSELATATGLLKQEVEALLTRESKLMDRCSALDEKLKAAEQALTQMRAELARETTSRTEAEAKLAEAGVARASLEKELHAVELRLKASEQALATAQSRLDLQARQQEQLAQERQEHLEQIQAYVGTVNELRSRVRARLAAKEDQSPSSPERRPKRSSAEK